MYPGGGGSGQGPGRNIGRTTGTIPRINSNNDASLSYRQNQPLSRNMMSGRSPFATSCGSVFSQQRPSAINALKNQVPVSWPSAENSSPRALHKNGPSNTFDPCRPAPDGWDSWGSSPPNSSYGLTGVRSLHADSETNGYLEPISLPPFHRSRMNGHDLRHSSMSSCSSQANNETCRNEIHLEQSRQCEPKKSNNIPRMNCSLDPSTSRSLPSPSLSVGQPASVPMSNVSLNGQGDAVNKSSEFYHRNELKLKLEEEERKLHALQEKQTVLLRRRNQMLNSPFESHLPEDSGQGEVLQRERAVDGRSNDPNRSRVDVELHSLKTNGHFVEDGVELRDGESSEDSAVEDSYDYMEAHTRAQVQGQIVRDKLAEINCLRAQLKQVKGLINMAQRSPGASTRSESSGAVNADFGSSEQAVNIRRQRSSQVNTNGDERQCQTVGNERGVADQNPGSKQSNASTKAEELENEKARLRHLQALIARVQEFHSANLPIPEYLLAELKSETEEGPSTRQNAVAESGRTPAERPVSPSTQDGIGEDFVGDQDDVDNDENAFAVRHPEQNELGSSHQAYFSQEHANAPSRRTKTVNVGGDFEHELDVASRGDVMSKFERPMEASFRRSTGFSATWDNVTSSTPLSNEDVPMPPSVENNEAELVRQPSTRGHDCSCQYHQQPDGQLQHFHDDENTQARAQQINHNSGSSLPDVTVRGVWSSVPESEDTSNSTNYPSNSRYDGHGIRQDNRPNSVNSSTINLFSHAQEVQNRLRALAQSYQGLLTEGHMEVLPGNRPDEMYPAMMSNLPPSINIFPPSSMATNNYDREHYYQQLFAASQLQYQQVLVTAVNQCYHLLWLQHQELTNLRSTVHMLTTNAAQISGMPQGQEPWGISPPSPAPVPPTLNNQVPPGNRTNNYWDNFRSYSRQNLLSAGQAKSNEVFSHNPSPLAQRSHNALHPSTSSNPLPSAPVTHLATGSVSTASALPLLSPLSGTPGQSALMGAVGPSLTSASFGPLPPTSSHHPESLDVDGGVAAVSEATYICRKDKRNVVYQNQQTRNDANLPGEVSSSGVCDVDPALLTQENSPPDVEVPMPMPFLRSHLALYQRLSNPLSESQADIANRCVHAVTRNQINSFPSTTGEVHPMHENVNETNHGRTREGTNWNPRQNDGPIDIANRCVHTVTRNQINSFPSTTGEVHPMHENINETNYGRTREGTNWNPRQNDGPADIANRCVHMVTRNQINSFPSTTGEVHPMHENVNETNYGRTREGTNWNPRQNDGPADIANRCVHTVTRNQINSFPSTTGEVHPMHENVNDTNQGRTREGTNWNRQNDGGSTWIGRQNWNNTSWTPNFQLDVPAQSAHTMPDFRFNNVSFPENQPGTTKRNSCTHKRLSDIFAPVNQTNFQRNIHSPSTTVPAQSRNIAPVSCKHEIPVGPSNECENKLSKNQPGFDSSRNFLSNQRSETQARGFVNRSEQMEPGDQEEQPMRCHSARHQAGFSETDHQSCEVNKNHLKGNRLQMNKSPKYNSKPVTPGSQAGAQSLSTNIRTASKSNQAGGISKRNQDSSKFSPSSQNYPEGIFEAVLAEVASLMSTNEYQPQVLAQLLRSLQLSYSDTQAENASQVVNSNVNTRQNEEATAAVQEKTASEEEERLAVKDTKPRRGRQTTPPAERHSNSSHSTYDRACSLPECETRGTAPNETGDKFKDLAVELSSYIRAHLHDTCTSSMIEEICSLVLMFVPFARNAHASGRTNPSQLEGLLENALHRFQGRRLEVVCDELTSVILKVLTNELSFVHLIDTLDQNTHETAAEAHRIPDPGWPNNEGGAVAAQSTSIAASAESLPSTPVMREPNDVDLLEIALVSELASNGDLAEADQSHSSSVTNGDLNRSLGLRPDVAAMEDEGLNAIGGMAPEDIAVFDLRPLSCEPSREHEPASSDSLKSRGQTENGESIGAGALTRQEWEESCEDQGIDHGLDQVPIRLAGDQHPNQTGSPSDSTGQ